MGRRAGAGAVIDRLVAQLRGRPGAVLLELGTSRAVNPWLWVPMVAGDLCLAAVAFLVLGPLLAMALVGLALWGVVLLLATSGRSTSLNERGILVPGKFIPWDCIRGFSFYGEDRMSVVGPGESLNASELTWEARCQAMLRSDAETIIRKMAPHAERLS